jgi:O-antigen/teichoic acid export membrane protein
VSTPPTSSLGDRVRAGVRWSAGAQYAGMLVRLAVAIALARLLGPAEFGVMAMAMAIVGVAALVQESGLGAALVRHRGPVEPAAAAMLVLTGAGGTLLALGLWLAAPRAGDLLAQPLLVPVLRAMAAACLLRAAAQTPRALLQRALRFRALALLELFGTVVYGAVGFAPACGASSPPSSRTS